MDWMDEVQRRKEELLEDLGGLLRIPSTYDLSTAGPDQPMGAEVARALSYMLELSSREGFRVKNEAGYYGYASTARERQMTTISPSSAIWMSYRRPENGQARRMSRPSATESCMRAALSTTRDRRWLLFTR